MRRWTKVFAVIVAVLVVILAVILLVVYLPKGGGTAEYDGVAKGAVVSNGGPCAAIGMKFLKKYGNAVDALIPTLLCDGLVTLNSMGVGGGFVATIYIREERQAYVLNSREVAPMKASRDMFGTNQNSQSRNGGLAVAVPGELRGYWVMYNRFGGKAPWAELFQDAIDMCRNGIPINKRVADDLSRQLDLIEQYPDFYALVQNKDGSILNFGDKMYNPTLANTLELVAQYGPDVLYNGSLTDGFINDIANAGGIITKEDLLNYKPEWIEPEEAHLANNLTIYTPSAPFGGPILAFTLKALEKGGFLEGGQENVSAVTEAFKFGYGQRSFLGDPLFVNLTELTRKMRSEQFIEYVARKLGVPETSQNVSYYLGGDFVTDHGTANMAVMAPNGDTIVSTNTVNLIFGSKILSPTTGILLNDEMDDFSLPNAPPNAFGVQPSESNYIQPGKVPVSSMCPTVFVNETTGDVRLAVGAAGGTRITTSTVLVALRNIFFGKSISEAVSSPRYHHQLTNMLWEYEYSVPKRTIQDMIARKHNVSKSSDAGVTSAISNINGLIEASSDIRRLGNVSYFY